MPAQGWSPQNGMSAFRRRHQRVSVSPSSRRTQKEEGFLQEPNQRISLNLDFPTSRAVRSQCLLFKPTLCMVFYVTARMKTQQVSAVLTLRSRSNSIFSRKSSLVLLGRISVSSLQHSGLPPQPLAQIFPEILTVRNSYGQLGIHLLSGNLPQLRPL